MYDSDGSMLHYSTHYGSSNTEESVLLMMSKCNIHEKVHEKFWQTIVYQKCKNILMPPLSKTVK